MSEQPYNRPSEHQDLERSLQELCDKVLMARAECDGLEFGTPELAAAEAESQRMYNEELDPVWQRLQRMRADIVLGEGLLKAKPWKLMIDECSYPSTFRLTWLDFKEEDAPALVRLLKMDSSNDAVLAWRDKPVVFLRLFKKAFQGAYEGKRLCLRFDTDQDCFDFIRRFRLTVDCDAANAKVQTLRKVYEDYQNRVDRFWLGFVANSCEGTDP